MPALQCRPPRLHPPRRYDLPLRQQSWARRFFWRSVFDTDGIDLGPERRAYLDHQLRCGRPGVVAFRAPPLWGRRGRRGRAHVCSGCARWGVCPPPAAHPPRALAYPPSRPHPTPHSRVWEFNDEGSIPYVPFLRAPYYVWVGRIPRLETLLVENKVPVGGGWVVGGARSTRLAARLPKAARCPNAISTGAPLTCAPLPPPPPPVPARWRPPPSSRPPSCTRSRGRTLWRTSRTSSWAATTWCSP